MFSKERSLSFDSKKGGFLRDSNVYVVAGAIQISTHRWGASRSDGRRAIAALLVKDLSLDEGLEASEFLGLRIHCNVCTKQSWLT